MSRYIYIIAVLGLLACGHQRVYAQLTFDPSEWNFGSIREADGKVSYTFTGENRGQKPLAILDVVATCGCTAPQFSKQPILSGDRTEIKVTFDPTNRPGAFAKELYIYSTDREKIATLVIRGQVDLRERSVEELYPVDVGGGLRLSSSICAFSYISQGQISQSAIGYINNSKRAISLELQATTSSGLLTLHYPRQIAAGERGEINLSYSIDASKPRYGTMRDLLAVYVDGHTNSTYLLVHAIGIDPLSPSDEAPRGQLSSMTLRFGTLKHRAKPQTRSVTLTNGGTSPLIIRAVEHNNKVSCSLVAGTQIVAGESLNVDVLLNPNEQEYGILSGQITIITNDPARPYMRLRATAIIED